MIGIIIVLSIGVLLICFFLFAIWRAILGKSSVDLRLSTSMEIHAKKIEALNKNFTQYSGVQDNLRKEMQEATRILKDLKNNAGKENSGGNITGDRD